MAFKGANRDFLQSPHCAPNRLQHGCNLVQITCNTSALITCNMCYAARRDGSAIKFDRVQNRIYLSFILLSDPLTELSSKSSRMS